MSQHLPKPTASPQRYVSQAEDTSVEADLYQMAKLRSLTIADRLVMTAALTRGAKTLSLWGIKQARGADFRRYFTQAVLGEKWSEAISTGGDEHLWIQDSIELAKQLHPIFEALQIPYYVTGGVAAAAYGEPRTTRDLDLVVQIPPQDITLISNSLQAEGFYCPPGGIEDIQSGRGATLSVTHMQTILNADITVNSATPFDDSKMERRRLVSIAPETSFWLLTPEDLILAKLLWGKGTSEKQWRDVKGVLKVQANVLDFNYLWYWGERLGIAQLVRRACDECGL